MELQPKESVDEKGGEIKTATEITNELIKSLLEDANLKSMIFNLDEIKGKVDQESKGPYQNVFFQEIEYMNALVSEIVRSLDEIDQGIKGFLTISEKME